MSLSPGIEDTYHMPVRPVVVLDHMSRKEEEGGEGNERREYWSRKPWKWHKKRRDYDDDDYDDGREYYPAPYQGQPGPSLYRSGPTGRRGRGYAGEEIGSDDEEYFSDEEEAGQDSRYVQAFRERDFGLYDSEEEDYAQDSEDYEEFQDRMYAGEKEYRADTRRSGSLRDSRDYRDSRESSLRRPSLYEPLKSGKDCPRRGLGRLIGANKEECKKACTSDRQKVVDEAHRSLVAKYASSRASDSRMPDKIAAKMTPVSLKASASDDIVRAPNKVIMVNEAKFETFQRKTYNRSDDMIKAFKANAIEHMRGLLGIDFSRMRNPDVKQKGSFLTIGNQFRMAPYVLGSEGSAKIKVTEARGFPSVKKEDKIVDSGFVVSVIADGAVTVHGKYGGKEGKPLTKGQSFYYGEVMVKAPRNVRKPEWFRAASLTPSMITEKNTSRAQMEVRWTSLFAPSASTAKTYSGQLTRVLKIERMKDSEGKTAKKVNSVYEFSF